MKKDNSMKKNSFVKGALFVTISIIFTKILGVLYVIPFHSLIGDSGGALYGYAYSIYVFFISLSSAGIPLAISKIISEYNALGNYDARDRAFYLGKRISLIFGIISFLILNIFAKSFASIIMGNLDGGNSVLDVAMVIRVISTAILIVPILSIYRGFYEGFKFMEPPSISQVIEQLVRIFIIIVGSFLAIKVFKLSLATSIGVAVFGATVGALVAYMYLVVKYLKNKEKFKNNVPKIKVPVANKDIIKKIILYAFPLIMIDLSRSLYNMIDTFTVVNGLVNEASYKVREAEAVVSMLNTWATKFNMLITAVATGVVVSLIPNLTQSIVNKEKKLVDKQVNQGIGLCLLITIPMTFGISFLAKPIWILFYGKSSVGPSLLSYFIFTGLFASVFTVLVTIIQVFKEYKTLFISLIIGVIAKLLFNTTLIASFSRMGFPAYGGVITATLMGYMLSIIYCFIFLNRKIKINFEDLLDNFFDILCGSIFMWIVLFLVKYIIPITSSIRILNLFIILLYAVIGCVAYFLYCYKSKTIERLLGKNFVAKLLKK